MASNRAQGRQEVVWRDLSVPVEMLHSPVEALVIQVEVAPLSSAAVRTATAASSTSGPMPSPG